MPEGWNASAVDASGPTTTRSYPLGASQGFSGIRASLRMRLKRRSRRPTGSSWTQGGWSDLVMDRREMDEPSGDENGKARDDLECWGRARATARSRARCTQRAPIPVPQTPTFVLERALPVSKFSRATQIFDEVHTCHPHRETIRVPAATLLDSGTAGGRNPSEATWKLLAWM